MCCSFCSAESKDLQKRMLLEKPLFLFVTTFHYIKVLISTQSDEWTRLQSWDGDNLHIAFPI